MDDLKEKTALEIRSIVADAVHQAMAGIKKHPEAELARGEHVDELQRQVRHLEVDRDEARSQAARLRSEREALLHAQASLEVELQRTKRALNEATMNLRHR